MGEVQLVQGDQAAGSTVHGSDFVEVVVKATGATTSVPAEWIGHPVLGHGISPVEPAPVVDVEELDTGPRPTSKSTTAELEAYAERAGIDLTDASTNPERLAAIDAAIAQAEADAEPGEPTVDPDVQLVAGTEGTQSFVPAARVSTTQDPDGTEPSDEIPPSGEEN